MAKLTAAQLEFLRNCVWTRGGTCGPSYKPMLQLVELGFIEKVNETPSTYRITAAGRAALEE